MDLTLVQQDHDPSCTTARSSVDGATKVLILDQDPQLLKALRACLEREGFDVVTATGQDEARAGLSNAEVDILVLGSGDGGCFHHFRSLSAFYNAPAILLSDDPNPMERIVALEVGADDLLKRPGNPRELLARLRSIVRWTAARSGVPSSLPPWRFDRENRTLTRPGGDTFYLSQNEAAMMRAFALHPAKIITGNHLPTFGARHAVSENTFRTTINRLRRKIGDDSGHVIRNVHGSGYVFYAPLVSASAPL